MYFVSVAVVGSLEYCGVLVGEFCRLSTVGM